LKKSKDGLEVSLGYDVKTDNPAVVLQVPKVYHNPEKVEVILNTFAARKELVLSPFFLNYFGYNTKNHPFSNLFFSEYVPLRPLPAVMALAKYRLTYDTRLFIFWARQILMAFRDLLFCTRYAFKLPVMLKHIYLSESNTRFADKNLH